jgi:actin-related protein
MADLDDFFAKKDKKKKSKKFVTANTDVLATKLEETARKEHQAEMKAVSAAMTTGESNFTKDSNAEGVSATIHLYSNNRWCNLSATAPATKFTLLA